MTNLLPNITPIKMSICGLRGKMSFLPLTLCSSSLPFYSFSFLLPFISPSNHRGAHSHNPTWEARVRLKKGCCFSSIHLLGQSQWQFHLHLIRCHVNAFDDIFKREEWGSWGWNSLGTITNSPWVMKLNVYETIKWNFPLRVRVSSKFYFIL